MELCKSLPMINLPPNLDIDIRDDMPVIELIQLLADRGLTLGNAPGGNLTAIPIDDIPVINPPPDACGDCGLKRNLCKCIVFNPNPF